MAGRLSVLEFAVASAALTLNAAQISAARRVLVDGEGQADVARAIGKTRQNVRYWTLRVLAAWEKQCDAMTAVVPAGWAVQIIAAPQDQMARIVAGIEAERQKRIAKGG